MLLSVTTDTMDNANNPGNGLFNERSAWPMVHVVVPFFLYVLLQNAKIAVLFFTLFESLELFVYIVCGGLYCIFPLVDPLESSADSLIGDILQGFIGIILGIALTTAFDVPKWNIGLREAWRGGYTTLWFKRLLQFSLFALSGIVANGRTVTCTTPSVENVENDYECIFPWGVYAFSGAYAVLFVIFFFANRNKLEQRLFWTHARTGKFRAFAYARFYLVWALASLFMQSSVFYSITRPYVQVWIHAAVLFCILLVVGFARGRLHKMLDFLTCGCYSLQKKRQRYSRETHCCQAKFKNTAKSKTSCS